ncbi:MarR family winged helix-turn-helix transcriptional regulator [Sphingomonas sanguinis]|uniref:MarR family winged helix-turn-helix transcriptional regulator n=1 Tax=Sphingomonas sanguinis TaxID=33051 RepID=UPI0007364253|nr:MarR family transcriptional regulator [Sphingomonas sanguinis]
MSEDIQQAALKIQIVATRLLRLARSAHGDYQLTSAQYSALSVLHERGALPLVELARAERVAHPTMSRIVAGLVKMGAVCRPAQEIDRRQRGVALTEEGRALYERIAGNRTAVMAAVLGKLTPSARQEVLDVVTSVVTEIEQRDDRS